MTTKLVPISKEAAKDALLAAAHQPDDDETLAATVHTFAAGGAVMLGADWDLEEALRFADVADELAWIEHPLQHDLAIRSEGRVIFFDARNPDRGS